MTNTTPMDRDSVQSNTLPIDGDEFQKTARGVLRTNLLEAWRPNFILAKGSRQNENTQAKKRSWIKLPLVQSAQERWIDVVVLSLFQSRLSLLFACFKTCPCCSWVLFMVQWVNLEGLMAKDTKLAKLPSCKTIVLVSQTDTYSLLEIKRIGVWK